VGVEVGGTVKQTHSCHINAISGTPTDIGRKGTKKLTKHKKDKFGKGKEERKVDEVVTAVWKGSGKCEGRRGRS